ncbi:MAG: energy-coupling factor transporter transmembrane component T [Nitrososphaerota archaeon]
MSLRIIEGLKFKNINTPIHRLDPRVKLLLSIYLFITVITFGAEWNGMLTISIIVILIEIFMLVIGRTVISMLNTLRGALPIILFIGLLQLIQFFNNSLPVELIFYRAIGYTIRFLAFLASFSLFFLTTSPDEVGKVLTFLKVPYNYSFALVAAIRFTPVIADEIQQIVDAQRSRGLEFEKGNIFIRLKNLTYIFVPLLISIIRRSYEMAEALEIKCFGASKKRTSYKELKIRNIEIFIAVFASILFISIMTAYYLQVFKGLP